MGFADKVKDALSGSGVQGGSTTGAGQASGGAGAGAAPGGAVGAGGSSGQQDYGDKGALLRMRSFSPQNKMIITQSYGST